MSVITRFAPSPTGYLHIGGARTALFNWLFARHYGGKFFLRIEDTDRARSTPEATQAILDGLRWLEINWDGDVVYQYARAIRHAEVALELLDKGYAYRCYCSTEELEAMKLEAMAQGKPPRYNGLWRDRDPKDAPTDRAPVIRFKAPQTGDAVIHDLVQGDVRVANDQLDDMVLLRSDGTPTYMLSVVVDDHDMGVTHIIRGDDHLTNAFRQFQIYLAAGWDVPHFAHIPLIHGADGAKLSKRHGALGVEAYRDEMGLLPEAVCNYLLRLSWGHGDDEIISRAQAIDWFTLEGVGRAAPRFDMAKLLHLDAHYLRERPAAELVALLEARATKPWSAAGRDRLEQGMPGLQTRSKTLIDLGESAEIYLQDAVTWHEKGLAIWEKAPLDLLRSLLPILETVAWDEAMLEQAVRAHAEASSVGMGQLAQPLRAALTGQGVSPSIFDVMVVLGRDLSLRRLHAALAR